MARNVRIRKLARRLSRRPEDLLGALRAMGYARYSSPEDTLAAELVERLEAHLAARPPLPAAEDFELLMRAQGVTPMGGRKSRPTSPPGPRPAPERRPAPGGAPRAASRIGAGGQRELLDRIELLQDRVRDLEDALARAESRAADTGADTGRARSALVTLFSRLEDRDRVIHELRARLSERYQPRGEPAPLRRALEARGLMGEDEQGRAMAALIEARRWPELAATLAVDRPGALAELLSQRLVLHCGRGRCAVPRYSAPVRVPPSRCEICAGQDLPGLMRRASDALMLRGLRRVMLIGGSAGEYRLLSDRLDERIELIGIPGRAPLIPRDQLEAAGLVILWTGAGPAPALVECLERALGALARPPRLSRRPEAALGRMLIGLISELEQT